MNRGSHAGGGFVFTTSWLEGQILVNNRSFATDNGVRWRGARWSGSCGTTAGAG